MAEGIFSKYERDELNKITAKNILEKLMNIRQNINVEFIARRLIWELMQNAKDNASLCNEDGEKVDVTISITEEAFIFAHNKGYFTNEHIRGLIRKYSSSDKDRDSDNPDQVYKTTGRFGTGFMTTHLLSEKVQIESYYKNDDKSFNKFSFWLDRSGKGEPEIIKGINDAFEDAEKNIARSESLYIDKIDFCTSFIYPLTEQKRKLAEIALQEVESGIAYTLINVPEINLVTVCNELLGNTTYRIEEINTSTYQHKDLSLFCLHIDGNRSKKYFLRLYEKDLQITIPISYDNFCYYVLEINSAIPRLHLDFPMVGTEDLNLPFIINSSLFEPTEPRNGVSLMGDTNETSQKNCDLIKRSVNLYKLFLEYISSSNEYQNLYNLARIKTPHKHDWIDNDWFKSNVVSPIRNELLNIPIVDVVAGKRISIIDATGKSQVYFPSAEKDNVRERIWNLSQIIYPEKIPIKEHINQWNDIIWKDCYQFTISKLSEEIQRQESIVNFANFINGEEEDAFIFLNNYYDLLNFEQEHIKDIIADVFKVIPNQLGLFRKKSELCIDKKIDEELKNACSIISQDPRNYLIHKNISTGITYDIKEQINIIGEINEIIKNGNSNISMCCDYLVSLFSFVNISKKREKIYEFSKQVYPDDFTQKRELKYFDEKIWEESDKNSVFYIVSKISEYKNISEASENLCFEDTKAFIVWLDSFITFLVKEGFENNISREEHPILPNQNGVFCVKDNLFLDSGDIGDKLKDISCELGYDFRNELLDATIFLELSKNRTHTIENVAEKISSAIKPIIRNIDKRKEYKETLKKFYLWMNENRNIAKLYFVDLFENKFLFLEDEDISQNMKKATELDKIMAEYAIESIEDLRIHLSKSNDLKNHNRSNNIMEKIDITQDLLVSLGVSSPEELAEAFKNPELSEFYHSSTHTTEMFIYVQNLIKRAKKNIIAHLINHPDYDCTDMEEIAPTILAGILKNGISFQIVVRPSDNGEVIIYYTSEKDALDCDNAELWVDNNIDAPHMLTLGRILKSTGINKIPVKMN